MRQGSYEWSLRYQDKKLPYTSELKIASFASKFQFVIKRIVTIWIFNTRARHSKNSPMSPKNSKTRNGSSTARRDSKGGFRFSRCVALPFAHSFEENKTYKRGLHSCESVNAEAVTCSDHACWWNGFHNVALRRVYVRAVLGRDWSKKKKVDHS